MVEKKKGRIDELESQVEELENRCRDTGERAEEKTRAALQAQQERDEVRRRLAHMEENYSVTIQQIEAVRLQGEESAMEAKAKDGQIQELSSGLSNMEAELFEISRLRDGLIAKVRMNSDLEATVLQKDLRIQELQVQSARHENLAAEREQKILSLEAEMKDWKARVQDLEAQAQRQHHRVDELQEFSCNGRHTDGAPVQLDRTQEVTPTSNGAGPLVSRPALLHVAACQGN